MIIGWVGLFLLLFAYILLVTPYKKYFIPVDTIASAILCVHAIMIGDLPFIIVNGFIAIILTRKWIEGDIKFEK